VAAAVTKSQEQASVAPPQKAEPFAFADFTWLNGNARTKELAMDTKFFHAGNQSRHRLHLRFQPSKDNTISGFERSFQGQ